MGGELTSKSSNYVLFIDHKVTKLQSNSSCQGESNFSSLHCFSAYRLKQSWHQFTFHLRKAELCRQVGSSEVREGWNLTWQVEGVC